MKKIEVVAAVILHENKILCTQRDSNKYEYISYKYEFPGGKLEEDETPEQALVREIKEELEIEITDLEVYMTVEHEYADFELVMHSYLCRPVSIDLRLKEHVSFMWMDREHLMQLDWAEADIPIVERLMHEK